MGAQDTGAGAANLARLERERRDDENCRKLEETNQIRGYPEFRVQG